MFNMYFLFRLTFVIFKMKLIPTLEPSVTIVIRKKDFVNIIFTVDYFLRGVFGLNLILYFIMVYTIKHKILNFMSQLSIKI